MKKKSAPSNKKNSTKQRPSASPKRIPRLFKALIAVGLLKLALLGYYGAGHWLLPNAPLTDHSRVTNVQVAEAAPAKSQDQPPGDAAAEPEKDKEGTPDASNKDADPAVDDHGALAQKWAEIREKKQELAQREKELRRLEKSLDAKLAKEKQIQTSIRKMLDEANVLKDKKIKHLIDVYSNMKAKQAALVLESLEEEIAVKILSGMRGRKAGEILSYVIPKKAALLSERLTDLRIPFSE
ncbi:MotE family protein [Desulfoplanes sp.]